MINTLNKIGMGNIWREQMTQNKDFSKYTKIVTDDTTIWLQDIASQSIIESLKKELSKTDKSNHQRHAYFWTLS